MEQTIYRQEMVRAQMPEIANFMGTRIAGPTLIHWGTEEQKQRYIPTILNGEEIWCQGYSEPGAGSDIASLQTRAVEEGDDFVINGQKVWTSYAQYAQFCLLLARTDPTVLNTRAFRVSSSICRRQGLPCVHCGRSMATQNSTKCFSTTCASQKESHWREESRLAGHTDYPDVRACDL